MLSHAGGSHRRCNSAGRLYGGFMSEQVFPYDDEDMEYDYRFHRYVLTKNAAARYRDPDMVFGDDVRSKRVLNQLSQQLYAWMREVSGGENWNYRYVEWALATQPQYRDMVYEMLFNMYVGAIESSRYMLAHHHGVDINKGKAMNQNDFKLDRAIDEQTKSIFKASDLYTGRKIPYRVKNYRQGY